MGLVIDSDVIIHFERKSAEIKDYIRGREREKFYVSVISISELLHGVHRAEDPATRNRRSAFVEAVITGFTILQIDVATARVHAQLWKDLQSKGIMIGIHDAWIAATCLSHGLSLISGNEREFGRVDGLNLEVWV